MKSLTRFKQVQIKYVKGEYKMRKYCLVAELKTEHIDEYVDIHKNAWPEMLKAIKNAGAEEEILFIYKNLSIIFFLCPDIDELFRKLNEEEVTKKWNATVGPWFEKAPAFVEKIFDLNQQLEGKLEQYQQDNH